ncbi:MAG: heavy-metal-associated domain-containing protein [Planctomycetota bacterium]|jgi:copper chaperone CopZ
MHAPARIVVAVALLVMAGCGSDAPEAAATVTEPVVLRYQVEGMTCDGCVQFVSTTIEGVDGVLSCEVSLESNSAVVRATDQAIGDAVAAALEPTGYGLRPERPTPESPDA